MGVFQGPMIFYLAYIALFLNSINAATCSTASPAGTVVLNECPLPVHTFKDGTPLSISYEPFTFKMPGVVVHTRALKMGNNPPRIPMGVLQFPKGATANVIFTNSIPNGVPSNLHTHGLHDTGGNNADGTIGDDVSVQVYSNRSQRYQFQVPGDHAGGLHWLHPHVHMYTEAQAGGGAYGVMVVEDDKNGLEIPKEILSAPSHILSFYNFHPSRLVKSMHGEFIVIVPANASEAYVTNGFTNPVLKVEQGKWTRLRCQHVSPDYVLFMQAQLKNKAECSMYLLATDGVYIPTGPRSVDKMDSGVATVYFTQASRVDLLIKCDGKVGSEIQFRTNNTLRNTPTNPNMKIFKIKVVKRTNNQKKDQWKPVFTPCLPSYLQDTTLLDHVSTPTFQFDLVGPPKNTINNNSFSGFSESHSFHNMTVGSVEEWVLNGVTHPLHVHVNPFQLMEDTSDGRHKRGDWLDVLVGTSPPYPRMRTRIDMFLGAVVVHCHIMGHEDEGMMGVMWIHPNASAPDGGIRSPQIWGKQVCTQPVKLVLPTKAPTQYPSKRN